jgi:hypothetical protein
LRHDVGGVASSAPCAFEVVAVAKVQWRWNLRVDLLLQLCTRSTEGKEVVGIESGLRGAPCVGLEVRAANSELLDEAKSKLQRHVSMTYLVLPTWNMFDITSHNLAVTISTYDFASKSCLWQPINAI